MEGGATSSGIDRRGLLFGLVGGGGLVVRPPWTDESRMTDACTRCGACLDACPERILVKGRGGFPQVDFRAGRGECTFCGDCAARCPEPVFDTGAVRPWAHRAAVDPTGCLAHAGIHCEVCRDACPEGAVRFTPRRGGPPVPEIVRDACTGCGACVGTCPEAAVHLTGSAEPTVAA